jgi:hypothetical protein
MVNYNPPVEQMHIARRNGKPSLKAEQALKVALKRGGLTECGAYRLMVEAWDTCITKAVEGNLEAMKLLVERLDGKPKQQIDTNVNVNVQFEQILSAGRARALSNTEQPLTIEAEEIQAIEQNIEHDVIEKE